MSMLLSAAASQPRIRPGHVLCHYTNHTHSIEVIRSCPSGSWYFETVVFPEQTLLFNAPPNAHIEVHTSTIASAILSDRRLCSDLQIHPVPTCSLEEVGCPA